MDHTLYCKNGPVNLVIDISVLTTVNWCFSAFQTCRMFKSAIYLPAQLKESSFIAYIQSYAASEQ